MYALTERDAPLEKKKPSRMPIVKAQRIDEIGKALKFVYESGIQMKLKPSPENLYSGDFKDVCLYYHRHYTSNSPPHLFGFLC